MNKDYIKKLLDKYFAAETTQEEERLLALYFNQANIDPELESYISVFRLFDDEKQIKAPINAADKLKLLQQQAEQKTKKRYIPYFSIAIAAGLILLLTIGLFTNNNQPVDNSVYIVMYSDGQQINDPALAMEYASQEFEKLSEVFGEANSLIRKPINTVEESLNPLKQTSSEIGKISDILRLTRNN